MFNAFLLSLRQLFDRRILLLFGKVLAVTLLLLVILGVGMHFGLTWLFALILPENGGLAAAATAALISILVAIFLFRIAAMFVINIFSDDVVDAVEAKHYPSLAAGAKAPSYALGLRMGIASAARALGYNLLATPVYAVLLITGIGVAIAFFAINAILIGRDLQDMVASRHAEDRGEMESDWTLPKATRFGLGLITALLLAVPFVNFLAPVLGAAMATHLVHKNRPEEPTS